MDGWASTMSDDARDDQGSTKHHDRSSSNSQTCAATLRFWKKLTGRQNITL
jgi:hypothetical protein